MEKDPAQKEQYLDMINRSIARLNVFINEIVDFSRNTRMELSLEEIDIQNLINEIFEELKFIEISSPIVKNIEKPCNKPFKSDRRRLKIILSNLISNSIRYNDPQKDLCKINISLACANGTFNLSVEDNGLGISNEHLPRIFDMFYRASDVNTGSGLGLYIVKETVDYLNGKIQVKSTIRQGTRFDLHFPD
jgi:signal transduction histidine kinase